jgi:hypothetical protein
MAKISAGGATEVSRLTTATGSSYLLRSDGVILIKSGVEGDGWRVFVRRPSLDAARVVFAKIMERAR